MNVYKKKLIGTALLLVMIFGAFLISSDNVRAQYMEIMNTIVTDGYVGEINENPDNFDLYNSGLNPLNLKVNDSTVFTSNLEFSDLNSGDWVKVVAKIENNEAIAKVVRQDNGNGYGKQGKPVVIHNAIFASSTENILTIQSSVAIINITINSSTHFVGQGLTDLEVDEELTVIGTDSGTEFLAKTIISKWQN